MHLIGCSCFKPMFVACRYEIMCQIILTAQQAYASQPIPCGEPANGHLFYLILYFEMHLPLWVTFTLAPIIVFHLVGYTGADCRVLVSSPWNQIWCALAGSAARPLRIFLRSGGQLPGDIRGVQGGKLPMCRWTYRRGKRDGQETPRRQATHKRCT